MITKIIVDKVASYKEAAVLETNKKVNLIFGLNGAGKTVISNYLGNLSGFISYSNALGLNHCHVEGFTPETQKVLVYNENFVREMFYEKDTQEGIFTLSSENKQAMLNIENARKEIKSLENDMGKEQLLLVAINDNIENLHAGIQNTIWEINKTHAVKGGIFNRARFLDGLKGSKTTLFDYLMKVKCYKNVTKTIDDLEGEVNDIISNNVTKREVIRELQASIQIENNPIFQEEIIGSQNSSVSALIKKLGNADWVNAGIAYLDNESIECPFCQQELTEELKKEIKNYFDETYSDKIKELEQLREQYQEIHQTIKHSTSWIVSTEFFNKEQTSEIESLSHNLMGIIKKNLHVIEDKITSPSQKAIFDNSQGAIAKINKFISERNREIEEFNKKIDNIGQTKEDLKNEFWKILRKEYDLVISGYQENLKQQENNRQKTEKSKGHIRQKIDNQYQIITTNQEQTINIEKTREAINKHLLDFGIQDFKIVQHDDSYRIKRDENGNGNPIFKSLSEGEKIVISFLYFIELCKGKESEYDNKEKIIVIDDPISSLSQMYVFNIAQLIKKQFTFEPKNKDYEQCFILTHNLYFFHELVDKKSAREKDEKKKTQKLFRVIKQNTSKIKEMKAHEIQNEYEAYWDIIRNASHKNMPLVANAMRNVIEYFFGFIEKKNDIFAIFRKDEFKGDEFQSFHRYINRESHSDPTNISDYKDFDLDKFEKAFKKIFEETGYMKHYEAHMEGKSDET